MTISSPVPFREALRRLDDRKVMPTALGTREIQDLDRRITQSAFFSARNLLTDYLQGAKDRIREILNPVTMKLADRVTSENPEGLVTVGKNDATVRLELRQLLKDNGYAPDLEDRGTVKDFSSHARLQLVIRTNVQIAQGYGYWLQGQDQAVLDEYPVSELFRAEERKEERDWSARWLAAAREVGDADAIRAFGETGRMVARKDSPVWQALGDGAGGYDSDALHNPYPPFAFQSGMDVMDVSRAEAMEMGLIDRDSQVTPQQQEFPVPDLQEELA